MICDSGRLINIRRAFSAVDIIILSSPSTMNHYHLPKHQLLAEIAMNAPTEMSVQDKENEVVKRMEGG